MTLDAASLRITPEILSPIAEIDEFKAPGGRVPSLRMPYGIRLLHIVF